MGSLDKLRKGKKEDGQKGTPPTTPTPAPAPAPIETPVKKPRAKPKPKPKVPLNVVEGTVEDQLRWVITHAISKKTFAYKDVFKAFEKVFGEWERSYETLSRIMRFMARKGSKTQFLKRVGAGEYAIYVENCGFLEEEET
jgi:hypothetical protein